MGPSVTVENLSLSLGNTTILQDVSIAVEAGAVHCFVGPNGGGKTSLIKSILGQMPHRGRISIDVPAGSSPVIGYVPQFLDFDRALPVTVDNFMALSCQRRPAFLGLSKTLRRDVERALLRVGLVGKRERKLGSLSGGERQRVLFAQALIPEPNLLVLDEPMTGMDEDGIDLFENIVAECGAAGTTVLWINHDLAQVKRMASTVTCINRQVVFHGAAADMLNRSDNAVLAKGA